MVGEAAGVADDIVGAIVAVVVVVLLVAAARFIVIPCSWFSSTGWCVALGLLAVITRVALRRPRSVDARDADGALLCRRVIGWRAGGAKVDEIADLVAAGHVPAGGQVVGPQREGDLEGGE